MDAKENSVGLCGAAWAWFFSVKKALLELGMTISSLDQAASWVTELIMIRSQVGSFHIVIQVCGN